MTTGIWGKKIGMTQFFVDDSAVPVTAIDLNGWVITNIRTKERDQKDAVQVGLLRDRYLNQPFSADWLKELKKYFRLIREIDLTQPDQNLAVGQSVDFLQLFSQNDMVDVVGLTRGRGFAGTIKRHAFNATPGSHGNTMGRRPGTLSFMRSQGRVIKGKRLPGHMGNRQRMMKNLQVVRVEQDAKVIFVKGSIPGHSGSFVFVRKI